MIVWLIFGLAALVVTYLGLAFAFDSVRCWHRQTPKTWGYPLLFPWRDVFTLLWLVPVWAIAFGAALGIQAIVSWGIGHGDLVGVQHTNLRALNNTTESEGSFFLGSGYTSDGPAYTYITQDGSAFSLHSIAAYNAVVVEVEGLAQPYRETGNLQPHEWWWTTIAVDAKTTFYVPKGSVQEPSYGLDITKENN